MKGKESVVTPSVTITAQFSVGSILFTAAEDGLRAWDLEKPPGIGNTANGDIAAHDPHFYPFPKGMMYVSSAVMTRHSIAWFSVANSLCLYSFDAAIGVWGEPFDISEMKEYKQIESNVPRKKVNCLQYAQELNVLSPTLGCERLCVNHSLCFSRRCPSHFLLGTRFSISRGTGKADDHHMHLSCDCLFCILTAM